jgi:XTP/dITP diphosphohydrolase
MIAMNRPKIVHIATGNAHKVQEFQQLADASAIKIQFVPAVNMPAVVEDTGTFVGNARKKALALKSILPADAWVLADDSGLCVDALGGAPGVESAYYAGKSGDADANLAKLVRVMEWIPAGRRSAFFVCLLILLGPTVDERVFKGICAGALKPAPTGTKGFGYDPLFVPQGYTETLAEMSGTKKNMISHRSVAFSEMTGWLRTGSGLSAA